MSGTNPNVGTYYVSLKDLNILAYYQNNINYTCWQPNQSGATNMKSVWVEVTSYKNSATNYTSGNYYREHSRVKQIVGLVTKYYISFAKVRPYFGPTTHPHLWKEITFPAGV